MCWESFVSDMRRGQVCGESFVPEVGPPLGPVAGLLPLTGTVAGSSVPLVFSMSVVMGVLHYTKPSCGVSPACRTLVSCNSPRLVTMRSRSGALLRPNRRPPRQMTLQTGCCGRGRLRFGHNGVRRAVLVAPKPLNMRVNPSIRTLTPRYTPGRRRPRADRRAHVRMRGLTCASRGQGPRPPPIGPACA